MPFGGPSLGVALSTPTGSGIDADTSTFGLQDQRPKAPDEKDWLKLFGGDQPVLILLDEMPPYFHYLDTQKVGNGTVADIATRAFANMFS